jgi:GntR family transcriptional regulator
MVAENYMMTEADMEIDKNSPIPMYYQIANDLKQKIEMRVWGIGEKLPNEIDLAKKYQVSRMTMNQAFAELVKSGIVRRERAKGTFVCKESSNAHVSGINFPLSFITQFTKKGLKPSARILSQEEMENPPQHIQEALQIHDNEPLFYVKRLFLTDNHPVAVTQSYFSSKICPNFFAQPLVNESLYDTFRVRYHLVPQKASHWVEAVRISEDDAELLKISRHTPSLLLTLLSVLANGKPLEYSLTYWNGDAIKLYIENQNDLFLDVNHH